MDMRTTLIDYLLPRRIIVARSLWKRLQMRTKLRVWRRALRSRGRVTLHKWVDPAHIYVLDTRVHFTDIATLPDLAHDSEHHRETIRLYGELALKQEAKQAASSFRVPFDC